MIPPFFFSFLVGLPLHLTSRQARFVFLAGVVQSPPFPTQRVAVPFSLMGSPPCALLFFFFSLVNFPSLSTVRFSFAQQRPSGVKLAHHQRKNAFPEPLFLSHGPFFFFFPRFSSQCFGTLARCGSSTGDLSEHRINRSQTHLPQKLELLPSFKSFSSIPAPPIPFQFCNSAFFLCAGLAGGGFSPSPFSASRYYTKSMSFYYPSHSTERTPPPRAAKVVT